MADSRDLRKRRVTLVVDNRKLIDKAEAEKRDITAEERLEWDKRDADIVSLTEQIQRVERQENLDEEMQRSDGPKAGGRQTADIPTDAKPPTVDEAFRSWLVHGMAGLTPEQRSVMATRQANISPEMRAQSVGLDTGGGYLVADGFVASIEKAMADYSGVRKTRATVMVTASGNDMHMPISNDTSNSGELLGEGVAATDKDVTFGSKALRAYMFSSKMIKVSLQFLMDSSVPGIEQWLAQILGERIGRAVGGYYINGTGSNQPEGLALSTTAGLTTASATAITFDELVDLEHSIDVAYRTRAEFLISDGALKLLKKLKDGEGRPLWVPGVAVKEPDTILSYRYSVDTNMPTPAASTKSVYFGDFSKFILRDVSSQQMLRLTERYAEYLQVAFLLFSRHDSILLDAGTHPIKHMLQHA